MGADLLHDLVIAPTVGCVGVFLARLLPRPWRYPVQAGVMASAIVLAVGWAPLRGYGHATAIGNPTVQPLDYSTAIAAVVSVVWSLVLCWFAIIAVRHHRAE